ncbi:MAG TPA: hypothetical protein VMH05_01895 [Bryobacteraceae bacterium]|nr:hypothetical protein [Bryobacteraceae bacterium]
MTRNLVRYFLTAGLVFLVLATQADVALAQDTPEMREVLSRLERLEQTNQALAEEIRALRKELTALRAPQPAAPAQATAQASPDPPPAPAAQPAVETQAVEQSRIEELAQTKVEASQKFPIRITGMALFNAYTNGRYNNESDNPTIASLSQGEATGGGTLRQSTLGLLFDGPATFLGGKVSGSLYMDFFGGSTSSLNHMVRLRTAAINLDWANTTLTVGQDKPIISPRDPDSYAQVGVSPLTGAGNLWLWQPQIRLEQRYSFDRDTGLKAQVAVFQTSLLNTVSDPDAYAAQLPGQQTEDSSPGAEARLELWHQWAETGRLEIAGGLHVNRNHVGPFELPSNIYTLDWFFRPIQKLEFSGTYFHGRNVAVLGGLHQGYDVLSRGRWVSVVSNGGWAQLRFPITPRLAFDIYAGQQDDLNGDLVTGFIAKNQAYFANVMYRLAPNVLVSLEGGQVRTSYFQVGTRLNDHYDLAVAYLF